MVDMAHFAGLGGRKGISQSRAVGGYCHDYDTQNAARTPGGIILCREAYAKAIDKAVFPGIQGGPLMHVIAGKAAALGEALTEDFHSYAVQIKKNSSPLPDVL